MRVGKGDQERPVQPERSEKEVNAMNPKVKMGDLNHEGEVRSRDTLNKIPRPAYLSAELYLYPTDSPLPQCPQRAAEAVTPKPSLNPNDQAMDVINTLADDGDEIRTLVEERKKEV